MNRDPTLLPGVRIVPEIVRCVFELSRVNFFYDSKYFCRRIPPGDILSLHSAACRLLGAGVGAAALFGPAHPALAQHAADAADAAEVPFIDASWR